MNEVKRKIQKGLMAIEIKVRSISERLLEKVIAEKHCIFVE
jgi:hypothetical protein